MVNWRSGTDARQSAEKPLRKAVAYRERERERELMHPCCQHDRMMMIIFRLLIV